MLCRWGFLFLPGCYEIGSLNKEENTAMKQLQRKLYHWLMFQPITGYLLFVLPIPLLAKYPAITALATYHASTKRYLALR